MILINTPAAIRSRKLLIFFWRICPSGFVGFRQSTEDQYSRTTLGSITCKELEVVTRNALPFPSPTHTHEGSRPKSHVRANCLIINRRPIGKATLATSLDVHQTGAGHSPMYWQSRGASGAGAPVFVLSVCDGNLRVPPLPDRPVSLFYFGWS